MKKATILILMLLILATTTLANNQTMNNCNNTSVWSDGECKPCAPGWNKINTTKCEFSGECFEGFEYKNGYCQALKNASIKCVKGSHLEKVNHTNTTIYDENGLPFKNIQVKNESWTCVPDTPKHIWTYTRYTLIGLIIIAFIILCIKRFIKWNNQNHGKGSSTAQEEKRQ